MNKKEAIEAMVKRDLNAVPQEWVQVVAEHNGEYPSLPMWGTMWFVDNYTGEKLVENSRVMVSSAEEIDLDGIEDKKERKRVEEAINTADYSVTEEYVDEEMAGERNVLDKDGNTTALFIYEVGDEYVIGVNGAGWNFYDGVWDRLYDLLGYQWHSEEK